MLSLSPQTLHDNARPRARRFIRAVKLAPLRWLCALLLLLLLENIAADALPLSRYEAQVREAVSKLKSLEPEAVANDSGESASQVATTLDEVRKLVPEAETVEWDGGTIQVDNSWLDKELKNYEKLSSSDPHKADALARVTERLSALEDSLSDLDEERKTSREGNESSSAGGSKSQDSERLKEILLRDEFNKQQPKESALSRLWNQFLDWLRSLFPSSRGLSSGQSSWLSIIAMIVIFGLAAGVLSYAIWKLLPFFERRRTRLKLERGEARVVLGERLAPDQTAADLMNEAEALARRGELRAAIRKAYIAVLCELGDRQVITLSQHKTNRDYLRALREKRNLLGEMQKLTNSFENHWYGFQQATADDWTSFRAVYQKVMSNV